METQTLIEAILEAWTDLPGRTAFCIEGTVDGQPLHAGHNPNDAMEFGSSFKVFVAAECCRLFERGELDWSESLTFHEEDRVISSDVYGDIADGTTIKIEDAVIAMIGESDNIATDLLLRRVGAENVRRLVLKCGLTSTTIPDSIQTVYQAELRGNDQVRACVSTAQDFALFYRRVFAEEFFTTSEALTHFRRIMAAEDRSQGTPWPDGYACLRKSGMLTVAPFLGLGVAGTITHAGEAVNFAMAFNGDVSDQEAPETYAGFGKGVRRAMRLLSGQSAD